MGSYEQQAERINALREFSQRNKTNLNKRETVIQEIQKHRENQSASIKFRQKVLESQKRSNYKKRIRPIKRNVEQWFSKGTIKKIHQRTYGTFKGPCK